MTTMPDRWAKLPGWFRWPVGIVLTLVAVGVMNLVAQGLGGSEDGWKTNLILFVLAAGLLGLAFIQARRRLGGKGQLGMYRRAIKTGRVPAEADVERWRPLVQRSARHLRGVRWLYLGYGVLLALAIVVGLVAGVLAGNLDARQVGVGLLILVPLAAFWWWMSRLFQRRVRQIERLARALGDDGSPAT